MASSFPCPRTPVSSTLNPTNETTEMHESKEAVSDKESFFRECTQGLPNLIGGSWALHALTSSDRRTTWEPNDLDIFLPACKGEECVKDFDRRVENFVQRAGGTVLKENLIDLSSTASCIDRGEIQEETDLPDQENFHRDLVKTVTVDFPFMKVPVQFVGIKCEAGLTLRDKLTQITDVPSSVTFSCDAQGKRIYQIPEKIVEPLFTRKVSYEEICPARVKKYSERGYTFVKE